MMKKRMLGTALMLMVIMTQLSAFASSYATYLVRDNKAVLSATDKLGAYVVIPKTFEKHEVTGIGTDAFKQDAELKSITLPETISFIEWGAFEDCENLTNINIPQNVKTIEDMTFAQCKSLKTIKLPDGLIEIGVRAFYGSGLEEIVIPKNVKHIDVNAFGNCKKLKTVVLTENVEHIGEGAFNGCENITIKCTKGTYAEEYLIANGISYVVI